ncbi:hypothetical protein Pyrfu_0351 [Pyrolobus fumarii 1A]|uniref:Uncharacterized protein n=1 Tax=Pyrolobus fumarii (strain DSM 11204 / 1A) TaxID=694429 RepID=G0EFQ2_PYRF1|nr:hypothetical protein [Pyrolobus fumarii]AEM38223.1 hypothetical protein Pyrfu_0351 [Pyrolobus fumarii 1A]
MGNPIFDALNELFKTLIDPVARFIAEFTVKPVIELSLAVPGFDVYTRDAPRVFHDLAPAMNAVYDTSLLLGILAYTFMTLLALLEYLYEDRVELGTVLKRSLLVLLAILLSKHVYDGAAALVAWGSYTLFSGNPEDVYLAKVTEGAAAVIGGATLLGAPAVLTAFFSIMIFLGMFNALRLMLTAVLAATLPLWLALTLAPARYVRDVAHGAVSTLTGLLFVPLLASAVYRLGSELITHWDPSGVYEAGLTLMMIAASFFAPVIASILAPRASTTMALTSMFLGYVAGPAAAKTIRQIVPHLAAAPELVRSPLPWPVTTPTGGIASRIVGFTRGLIHAIREPTYPLGGLGYILQHAYKHTLWKLQTRRYYKRVVDETLGIPWHAFTHQQQEY